MDLIWDVRERSIKNTRKVELSPAETEKTESIANLRRQGSYQKTGEKRKLFFLLQHEKHTNGILLCLLAIRRGFIVYKL